VADLAACAVQSVAPRFDDTFRAYQRRVAERRDTPTRASDYPKFMNERAALGKRKYISRAWYVPSTVWVGSIANYTSRAPCSFLVAFRIEPVRMNALHFVYITPLERMFETLKSGIRSRHFQALCFARLGCH
jgi:hypothetical protein